MTTLREVKHFLAATRLIDPDYLFNGFSNPHHVARGASYAVAFQPALRVMTADEILAVIDKAVTETFTGLNGAEYEYTLSDHGHLDRDGRYTETAMQDFTNLFEKMQADWNLCRKVKEVTNKPRTRITKAEKQAAAEQLRKEQQEKESAEFRSTYQHNLLSMIADHITMNWRVLIDNNEFKFDASSKTFPVALPDEMTYLEILDFVESMEDVRRSINKAIEILIAKKQSALSKLTKEERELLGLL